LYRRLGGPQSRAGLGGEEKNFQPLPDLEPRTIQPLTQCYTTELYWLLLETEFVRKFCSLKDIIYK
jgi:hypothetical protein